MSLRLDFARNGWLGGGVLKAAFAAFEVADEFCRCRERILSVSGANPVGVGSESCPKLTLTIHVTPVGMICESSRRHKSFAVSILSQRRTGIRLFFPRRYSRGPKCYPRMRPPATRLRATRRMRQASSHLVGARTCVLGRDDFRGNLGLSFVALGAGRDGGGGVSRRASRHSIAPRFDAPLSFPDDSSDILCGACVDLLVPRHIGWLSGVFRKGCPQTLEVSCTFRGGLVAI